MPVSDSSASACGIAADGTRLNEKETAPEPNAIQAESSEKAPAAVHLEGVSSTDGKGSSYPMDDELCVYPLAAPGLR